METYTIDFAVAASGASACVVVPDAARLAVSAAAHVAAACAAAPEAPAARVGAAAPEAHVAQV